MEFDKDWVEKNGFEGFKKVSELKTSSQRKIIPLQKGVYLVFRNSDSQPEFSNNKELLLDYWVENANVIYIGQAGGRASKVTLRKRLSQYIRKSKIHKGGKSIWELEDSDDLLIAWKSTIDDPYDVETKLIEMFKSIYHKRPFANKLK